MLLDKHIILDEEGIQKESYYECLKRLISKNQR